QSFPSMEIVSDTNFDRNRTALILDLVGFFQPGAKRGQRLFTHHLDHRYSALGMCLSDFAVDKRIVKSGVGCVGGQATEINPGNTRPINCAQAHGAGLARSVEFAALQLEEAELPASLADGENLS